MQTKESSICISLHTLAVNVNPSFPCHWVSDGRLQLLSVGIILGHCAGVSWLAHGHSLVCPLWIPFPSRYLIGPDELSEVLLKGACLGRQRAQNVCNVKPLCDAMKAALRQTSIQLYAAGFHSLRC